MKIYIINIKGSLKSSSLVVLAIWIIFEVSLRDLGVFWVARGEIKAGPSPLQSNNLIQKAGSKRKTRLTSQLSSPEPGPVSSTGLPNITSENSTGGGESLRLLGKGASVTISLRQRGFTNWEGKAFVAARYSQNLEGEKEGEPKSWLRSITPEPK